jgi:hypothetical protein
MHSLTTFRIILVTLALTVGLHALTSTLAEWEALDRPVFPSDPAKIIAPTASEVPRWLQVVSPFRSDIESNHALIAAFQAIQAGKVGPANERLNDLTRERVRKVLSIAPYSSELWLALALLQAQRDPRDSTFSEALKMSYFLAPNEAQLMPVRLDTATLFHALADPDIKELARGDVRLMLTRQAELRTAVTSAYRRASSRGKAFLEEAVRSIDPSFVAMLRG